MESLTIFESWGGLVLDCKCWADEFLTSLLPLFVWRYLTFVSNFEGLFSSSPETTAAYPFLLKIDWAMGILAIVIPSGFLAILRGAFGLIRWATNTWTSCSFPLLLLLGPTLVLMSWTLGTPLAWWFNLLWSLRALQGFRMLYYWKSLYLTLKENDI